MDIDKSEMLLTEYEDYGTLASDDTRLLVAILRELVWVRREVTPLLKEYKEFKSMSGGQKIRALVSNGSRTRL
jgi:hypothetical protein